MILDGYGINDKVEGNAIKQANTPVMDGLMEKYPAQVFATAKKMGAETAEANMNAGLAAARQIVDFLVNGNRRFQVNK